MDFEILDDDQRPVGILNGIRKFILGSRRQMQEWGDRAPYLAAATVFGLVVVEWVLSQRLSHGMGRGMSALNQALAAAVFIFLSEFMVVGAAGAIASLTGKSGNRSAALAYLSLGLSPLLLLIPVTLMCEAGNAPPLLRSLVILLLVLKVLAYWRDAIETVYKLNRLQSAAAFYASAGAIVGIGLLVIYAGIIAKVASALS
jgi:hypothetical protein